MQQLLFHTKRINELAPVGTVSRNGIVKFLDALARNRDRIVAGLACTEAAKGQSGLYLGAVESPHRLPRAKESDRTWHDLSRYGWRAFQCRANQCSFTVMAQRLDRETEGT